MITFKFQTSETGIEDLYPFRSLQDFLIQSFQPYVWFEIVNRKRVEDDNDININYDDLFKLTDLRYYRVEYYLDTYARENICSVVGVFNGKKSWYWVVDIKGNDKLEQEYLIETAKYLGEFIVN
jgi:hypothetical protein